MTFPYDQIVSIDQSKGGMKKYFYDGESDHRAMKVANGLGPCMFPVAEDSNIPSNVPLS